jgi:cellobiose phosphorylase
VTYRITVNNPEKRMKGVKAITLNGEPVKGNLIPLLPAGSVGEVEVIL